VPCGDHTRHARLRLPLLQRADSPRPPPSPPRAAELVADPPLVARAPDAVEALARLLGAVCGHTPALDSGTVAVPTCAGAGSRAPADHATSWLGVMRSFSGMPSGSVYCVGSEPYSTSPPNGKPPTTMVGGSTVLFGWCGRWGRTGSVSDASWLGGRGDHLFPAGATALAAGDRRGDIVDGQLSGAAARTALRGVALHVRRVGGLNPPQGLECGPGLRPELG